MKVQIFKTKLIKSVFSKNVSQVITPFVPQCQYGFLKGSGAQDCGTAIGSFATQALVQECQVVSLDIKGRFQSYLVKWLVTPYL